VSEVREDVLLALYGAELRGTLEVTGLGTRARELAEGVWERRAELDETLESASNRWRVERMPVIDRSVLRLALFELRYRPGLPVGVIISEAVRLATSYSTEKSGGFVNGVLGRVAEGERVPSS
jgi:N utilization substance protein B